MKLFSVSLLLVSIFSNAMAQSNGPIPKYFNMSDEDYVATKKISASKVSFNSGILKIQFTSLTEAQEYSCSEFNKSCSIIRDGTGYAKSATLFRDGSILYENAESEVTVLVKLSAIKDKVPAREVVTYISSPAPEPTRPTRDRDAVNWDTYCELCPGNDIRNKSKEKY